MKQRVITAIVALVIFIPILFIGGSLIDFAAWVLALVALSETFIMRKKIIVSFDALIAALAVTDIVLPRTFFGWLPSNLNQGDIFYILVMIMLAFTVVTHNKVSFEDIAITMMFSLYIGVGFHYLAAARNPMSGGSLTTIFYILLVIWATDIGAYMIGRKIGKHKLYPAVSPNKTWEGSIGGILCAVIVAMIYLAIFPNAVPSQYSLVTMFILTIIFSICGEIGDLVESAYKRYYGVKDSGNILPGHGGILDRFDSLLFVLPLLHIFGILPL